MQPPAQKSLKFFVTHSDSFHCTQHVKRVEIFSASHLIEFGKLIKLSCK